MGTERDWTGGRARLSRIADLRRFSPPELGFSPIFFYLARLVCTTHARTQHNNASILSRPIPTHHQSIPPTSLLNRNSSHELACKRILVPHDERTRQTCSLCISLKGSVSFFVCSTSRYSRGHLTYSKQQPTWHLMTDLSSIYIRRMMCIIYN